MVVLGGVVLAFFERGGVGGGWCCAFRGGGGGGWSVMLVKDVVEKRLRKHIVGGMFGSLHFFLVGWPLSGTWLISESRGTRVVVWRSQCQSRDLQGIGTILFNKQSYL